MNKNKIFFLLTTIIITSCSSEIPVTEGEFTIFDCSLSNCYQAIEEHIARAEHLECAFYNIEETLAEEMARKGKLITDEDAKSKWGKQRRGTGLMHHKFCVINESYVITGSFNAQANKGDYNNLLLIASPAIARHYQNIHKQLLQGKKQESTHNQFKHNNISIELYACPQDKCQEKLLRQLEIAEEEIQFALFTFTDQKVGDVLIEKKAQEDILVKGVVESWQSSYAQHPRLQEQGIPVCLERTHLLQHNKVFVVDKKTVITGSYNPTKAAHTINDESLIIMHSEDAAKFYLELIERINSASC